MTSGNHMKLLVLLFTTVSMQLTTPTALRAQSKTSETPASEVKKKPPSITELHRRRVNSGTLGIISGGITGTYLHVATDLASVLDNDKAPRIRILPIAGRGGVSNIEDLMYLRGVDMAIVQSDVLSYIETRKLFRNVRKRVQYITKLYDSELHIIANRKIKDVRDLDGQTVNLWNKGSATDITAQNLFRFLNISPKPVYFDNKRGIEKTKNGEIAATFLVVGKPVKYYQKLSPSSGLHFLPVKYEGKLVDDYLPSKLSHQDYPN
ncbi:MAG: TAXI family TRAP transporter solute-binding subunit, partial [Methyloligellaceae bacterium]